MEHLGPNPVKGSGNTHSTSIIKYRGLPSRSKDQLAETISIIDGQGGRAISIPEDVSKPDDVNNVVKEVENQLGPTDILVNNAGIGGPVLHICSHLARARNL